MTSQDRTFVGDKHKLLRYLANEKGQVFPSAHSELNAKTTSSLKLFQKSTVTRVKYPKLASFWQEYMGCNYQFYSCIHLFL